MFVCVNDIRWNTIMFCSWFSYLCCCDTSFLPAGCYVTSYRNWDKKHVYCEHQKVYSRRMTRGRPSLNYRNQRPCGLDIYTYLQYLHVYVCTYLIYLQYTVSVLAKISTQVAVIREGDHRNQRPCGRDITYLLCIYIFRYVQYLHR